MTLVYPIGRAPSRTLPPARASSAALESHSPKKWSQALARSFALWSWYKTNTTLALPTDLAFRNQMEVDFEWLFISRLVVV